MTHKPVKTEFRWTGDGFGDSNARNIKQLVREGDIAIYERTAEKTGHVDGYEVVKIGRHNGYTLGKQRVEPAETYPGATAFGKQAFFVPTIERAKTMFKVWVLEEQAKAAQEAVALTSGIVAKKRGRPAKAKAVAP